MAHLGNTEADTGFGDDDIYTQLWKICAGPLVDVPHTEGRVYYFPQGHMEQMIHRINFIHEINASRDTWKLKVRIIGLWRVSRSSTPSIEMIFMDEKGDKIQAIVKKYRIAQWEPQLQEGKSYIAENFDIVPNEGRYRSSNHSFKLIFQKGTIMKNKELPEIPLYIYKFTTFEDILNGVVTSDVLVDVIGEFVDIEMSQPESTPKKVVFIMQDQRGNRISCTLWGQFATQLLKYEEDHKLDPIVVILTLAKIKEARGCYPITIQNAMYTSKLYINDNNIPEIQYFTSRYHNFFFHIQQPTFVSFFVYISIIFIIFLSCNLDTSKSYESYSQSMSQSSSCSQGRLQDKFFYNATVKTIGEIIHVCEESVSLTYGIIDKLFSNGWYYEGCPHCNRKTDTISMPGNCVGCGKYLDDVVARYRIEVRVSYGHDSMKFVLWNRECEQLIKQPAVDLRELLLSEGELNPMHIPKVVNDIVRKVLAFKVKVQPNYKRCSVIQVSDDSQLITCLLDKITPYMATKTYEKGKSVANMDKKDDGFECIIKHI